MSYHDRTKEELEEELTLRDRLKAERVESDKLYAKILAEKIVYGLVTIILIAVVGAIISLVIK